MARRRKNRKYQDAKMQKRRSDSERRTDCCVDHVDCFLFFLFLFKYWRSTVFQRVQIIVDENRSKGIDAERGIGGHSSTCCRYQVEGIRSSWRHVNEVSVDRPNRRSGIARVRHARGRAEIYLANNLLLLARVPCVVKVSSRLNGDPTRRE